MGTKVCSNHFVQGYRIRNSHSRAQPVFMKGYDCEDKPQRPAPRIRYRNIRGKDKKKEAKW